MTSSSFRIAAARRFWAVELCFAHASGSSGAFCRQCCALSEARRQNSSDSNDDVVHGDELLRKSARLQSVAGLRKRLADKEKQQADEEIEEIGHSRFTSAARLASM